MIGKASKHTTRQLILYGPVSDLIASVECGPTEYGEIIWFKIPAHWPQGERLMPAERNDGVNEVLNVMIIKYFDFSIKIIKQSF